MLNTVKEKLNIGNASNNNGSLGSLIIFKCKRKHLCTLDVYLTVIWKNRRQCWKACVRIDALIILLVIILRIYQSWSFHELNSVVTLLVNYLKEIRPEVKINIYTKTSVFITNQKNLVSNYIRSLVTKKSRFSSFTASFPGGAYKLVALTRCLLFQVFLPGFLSSNLYYKYLNDLIHSVRGDEFLGGSGSLTAPGSMGPPDDSHPGAADSATSQVVTRVPSH